MTNTAKIHVTTVYLEELTPEEVETVLRNVMKSNPQVKKVITTIAGELAEEKARDDFVRSF